MALMSWELFEALADTIEIQSDPELMAQINQREIDVSQGKTILPSEIIAVLNIKPDAAPA
jgi:PHD/YefM family antitoxin component YafN of YafNO toxin-antitoxin module